MRYLRPERTRQAGRRAPRGGLDRLSEPRFHAAALLGIAALFAVFVAVRGGDQAGAATQDFGTVPVGSSITTNGPCGYAPGSSVTLTADGSSLTKTADGGGCIHVLIRVVSQSQVAYDETIFVTATCGQNSFVANGNGPAGMASGGGMATGPGPAVSNTGTFTIPCSPPPTTPVGTCSQTTDPLDLGTRNVGETFGTSVCAPWTPGQRVNFTLNGIVAGGKTASADGSVPVSISVLSQSSVSVDDIVPASCGQNTLRLTGPGFGGTTLTRTVLFRINCNNPFFFGTSNPFFPNLFGTGFPFANATQPGLVIAPTQANSQQQQEQQQSVAIPAGSSAGTPAAAAAPAAAQGRVAFTGGRISVWLGVAILLLTLGVAFIAPTPKLRRWFGFPVRN